MLLSEGKEGTVLECSKKAMLALDMTGALDRKELSNCCESYNVYSTVITTTTLFKTILWEWYGLLFSIPWFFLVVTTVLWSPGVLFEV
jgi:hypothetical protein